MNHNQTIPPISRDLGYQFNKDIIFVMFKAGNWTLSVTFDNHVILDWYTDVMNDDIELIYIHIIKTPV